VAVPLATYTGWNFRSASIGRPDDLLPLTGSFIPFAATETARRETSDPRASIEARYGERADYEKRVREAAAKLVADRYLRNEDAPAVVARALKTWDELTRGTSLSQK
jgi:hypothetical protein